MDNVRDKLPIMLIPVETYPRVFDPTNPQELGELQRSMVQMTNWFTDEMNDRDRELKDHWKVLVSIYNYFDEMGSKHP